MRSFRRQAETERSWLKVNCLKGAREAPLGDCGGAGKELFGAACLLDA